jgi:hypothetical protein
MHWVRNAARLVTRGCIAETTTVGEAGQDRRHEFVQWWKNSSLG